MKVVDAALFTKLTADNGVGGVAALATGGIHRALAPQGRTPPYVIFTQQSAVDIYTIGRRVFIAFVYLVKAVDKNLSATNAAAISDRADTLLTDGALTITGYTLTKCRRGQQVEYVEDVAGVIWQHVGGLYEIEMTPN